MNKIQLTLLQRKAVESKSRKIAVIAGPGSGKTRVLTERICHLITDNDVDSENILALTFTNKAAMEMRKRTHERLRGDWKIPSIMTFHKLGMEILRKFASLIGYENDFEIINPTEKNNILRELLEEEDIAPNEIINISRNITYIKNGMQIENKKLVDLSEKYEVIIKSKNAFDLDDLVYKALQLLNENPDVCEFYKKQYKYILIDEYQDVNNVQKKIIDLISGQDANLFAVGDDDQCIYEWRGSAPELLGGFVNEDGVEVIRLEENFRSDNSIVKISDAFISNNLKRIKKQAIARKKVEIQTDDERKITFQKYSSRESEAEGICKSIKKLVKKENMQFGDFAVLVRQQGQCEVLKEHLKENDIPFNEHNNSDEKYLEVLRVLEFVRNPQKDKYLAGAFNFPTRALPNSVYKQLVDLYGWKDLSLRKIFENIYMLEEDFKSSEVFRGRYKLLFDLHQKRNYIKSSEVFETLLDHYNLEHSNSIVAESKIEVLKQLLEVSKEFERGQFEEVSRCTIENFLDYLKCVLQNEDEPEISLDSVNIMTCHKAKGLEFPVVFIPGVQVGIFPNDFFVKNDNELEQERRLFYVSMTRAINYLFLSSNSNPIYVPENSVIKRSFITELMEELR